MSTPPIEPQGTERAASPVGGRSSMGRGHVALAIVGATTLALGFVGYRAATQRPKETPHAQLAVQPTVHYEPAPPQLQPVIFRPPPMTPAPPPPPASPVAPPPTPAVIPQQRPPEQDPARQARHASLLAYGSVGNPGGAQQGGGAGGGVVAGGGGQRPTELATKLVPTQVTAVSATVLRNQPYLLTRGRPIPCVLETAIDSTLPGPFVCRVPFDVQSKYHVTLIDAGSIITGETGGSMRQGEARLFGLVSRVETPLGVVADLNSPVTDALGRGGMEGDLETHAGARIFNSILVALTSGGMQAAAAMASAQGAGNIMNLGGTESSVSEALRGSTNLRPTMKMNQGDLIAVGLMREVDFKGVYALSVR